MKLNQLRFGVVFILALTSQYSFADLDPVVSKITYQARESGGRLHWKYRNFFDSHLIDVYLGKANGSIKWAAFKIDFHPHLNNYSGKWDTFFRKRIDAGKVAPCQTRRKGNHVLISGQFGRFCYYTHSQPIGLNYAYFYFAGPDQMKHFEKGFERFWLRQSTKRRSEMEFELRADGNVLTPIVRAVGGRLSGRFQSVDLR